MMRHLDSLEESSMISGIPDSTLKKRSWQGSASNEKPVWNTSPAAYDSDARKNGYQQRKEIASLRNECQTTE
jgi:hypothetical protein